MAVGVGKGENSDFWLLLGHWCRIDASIASCNELKHYTIASPSTAVHIAISDCAPSGVTNDLISFEAFSSRFKLLSWSWSCESMTQIICEVQSTLYSSWTWPVFSESFTDFGNLGHLRRENGAWSLVYLKHLKLCESRCVWLDARSEWPNLLALHEILELLSDSHSAEVRLGTAIQT